MDRTRTWGLLALGFALAGCQTSHVREGAPEAKPAIARSIESVESAPISAASAPPDEELATAGAETAESAVADPAGEAATERLATTAETPPELWIRVADVGQALCVVGVTADGYSFLIDAGHWNGHRCADAVEALVPEGGGLSLVILTHNDSDHLGNLPEILQRDVDTILWTGRVPPACRSGGSACASAYKDAAKAIGDAAAQGTTVINLRTTSLEPGETFVLGDVEVMFLAGWNEFPDVTGLSEAEQENAISIMSRISYGGNSVLVTGDAIGRPLDGDDDACTASEAWAVQNVDAQWLSANVLVASHHGGDNGSAGCFITAVAPEYVVFSAGSQFDHPRHSTAQRFISRGIQPAKMLRTDRGSKSEDKEWVDGLTQRCGDGPGDDDIDIVFTAGEPLDIGYVSADACQDL